MSSENGGRAEQHAAEHLPESDRPHADRPETETEEVAAEAGVPPEEVEAAKDEAAEERIAAAPGHGHEADMPIGIDPTVDPIEDEEVREREAGVDEDNPFGRPGKPMSRRSPFRVGFSAALGAGLVYVLWTALVNAKGTIVLILVAAFLAIGLNPTVSRLERLGMKRGWAVGLVFLGFVAFLTIVGYAVVPPVVEQVGHFVQAVPQYVKDLQDNRSVRNLDEKYHFIEKVQDFLTQYGSKIGQSAASNIAGAVSTLAGLFFNTLTVLILTLYFLSSFNQIKATAYRSTPRSRRARVALLGDEILSRVGGYVAGAFVIALFAGTSSLIFLSIADVPYPLALALVVTITDVIPLVGATIGAIIVTVIAFFVSIPVGIASGVFFLIYQQVENYVIYPRVMKRSVDVNPAAAIVAVLLGGALLGIVGALLAVPVTAALQLLFREVLMPRQEQS